VNSAGNRGRIVGPPGRPRKVIGLLGILFEKMLEYNEEKHKLNKIKTWASCLPDEVREKDYEMDLFDGNRGRIVGPPGRPRKVIGLLGILFEKMLDRTGNSPPSTR
jgi:hypothetical protein